MLCGGRAAGNASETLRAYARQLGDGRERGESEVSERTARLPQATRTAMPARIAAGTFVAVLLAAGVFAFGRISDDMNVAMAATAAWFGVVFVGAGLVALRRRELAAPLAAGYAVVAVAAAILVVYPTLN